MTIKAPPQDRNCPAEGRGLVNIMSQPAYDEKPPATALRASAEEELASHPRLRHPRHRMRCCCMNSRFTKSSWRCKTRNCNAGSCNSN